MKKFDYIVLGGGSGGIASARRAASYGAKVALIEYKDLGGTCVNVGCVPKKVMWNAAQIFESIEHSASYGFSKVHPELDFTDLKNKRDAYVLRLNGIYANMLKNSGVEHFQGKGQIVGSNKVEVNGETLEADHILIATGGRPYIEDIPGANLGESSDGFFELETLPKKVVVIGSGYIGVEIAGVLNTFGSDVTILCRRDSVLRNFGEDISTWITGEIESKGIKIERKSQVSRIEEVEDSKIVHLEDGRSFEADYVIWAIGRKPNVENIGIESVGIKQNENGSVWVDEFQNTSSKGIYAVGDVIGKIDLTPVAIAAGRKLAARLFDGKEDAKISYENVASVVFSHPPLGSVGLTEEEALERYGEENIKVYRSKFTNMYYSPLQESQKEKTYMKLICEGESEKVIGLQCVGLGADEIIQGFAVAVVMGATKADFDRTTAIHPTAGEEFVTMT